MLFIDTEHEKFYSQNMTRIINDKKPVNPYVQQMVYLLGLTTETRLNFSNIFDVNKQVIILNALNIKWNNDECKNIILSSME